MKFNEYKLFPYNWKTDEWKEKNGIVQLSPFSIEGVVYNILPPNIQQTVCVGTNTSVLQV